MLVINHSHAQPYTLKSVGEAKEFRLKIYFGTRGKGAFVQYAGQKGILALSLKKYAVDSSERKSGQPDFTTYVWDEIVNGKITGSYGLTEGLREISDIWYWRKKDGKRFSLKDVEDKAPYTGSNKHLLHGVLLSFNHLNNDQLNFDYPGGIKKTIQLPSYDSPDYVRQSNIIDYNFDGYDDVSFSIPDGGMGVYQIFNIWLYNPKIKRFEELKEPDYTKSNCTGLCNVSVDRKPKLFLTSCRGAATWWQDVYRFGSNNKLVWIKSNKLN